jgi:hypothetical protein
MDGPVVTAARDALERGEVDVAPSFVPVDGEDEVRAAFDLARKARTEGGAARGRRSVLLRHGRAGSTGLKGAPRLPGVPRVGRVAGG